MAEKAIKGPFDVAEKEAPLPTMRGGQQLARFIDDYGYKHIFAIPGSTTAGILHSLQSCAAEFVPSIHESVTVAMADGYARVSGAGLALIYMMPGTANGLANLCNAWCDESPLVVIAGQQTTRLRTPGWTVCEADLVGITQRFTRLSQELAPTMPLRPWLDQARRTSMGPVPGPVFLSIPEDIIDYPQPVEESRVSVRPNLGVPDITAIAEALRGAERPLIVVGGQLARFGGASAIESLSLSQNIPLAYEASFNDRLGAAPGHPHMFGHIIGAAALIEQTADVVLVIGARYMLDAHPKPAWFPQARFIAHINADPAKLEATRSADWAAAADPGAAAAALRDAMSASSAAPDVLERRKHWIASLRKRPLDGFLETISNYLEAVAPLHDALDHGWLVDESVLAIFALQHCLSSTDGRRYISTSGGSLGWGTGAAVGVALASGEPVTLVIGDGSLRFGALGLWSIAASKLPITIIVLDNGGYGSTRLFEQLYVAKLGHEARPQRPGYLGSDLRELGPSVHSIIEGFGIPCRTLEAGEDARSAVLAAWETGKEGPVALVLPVDFRG